MTNQPNPAQQASDVKVWDCKIGTRYKVSLPMGADSPMRQAVSAEFRHLTGQDCEFLFSGWGGKLNESELAVVENRLPGPEVRRAELLAELATLPPARELTAAQGVSPAGFTVTREPDDTPGKNWPDVFVIRRGNDHDEIVQGDSELLWEFFAALSQPSEPQGAGGA